MTEDFNTVKSRGRRPQSVLKRLGREGQLSEHDWPDRASPCWPGPALISFEGAMCRTPRACLNDAMPEPLQSTHRLQRLCNRDDCVNPHHYRIADIRRQNGEPIAPLPQWAFMQVVLEDQEREANKPRADRLIEIAQSIRPILEREPDLSDADLAARLLHEYSEEDIRDARTVEL